MVLMVWGIFRRGMVFPDSKATLQRPPQICRYHASTFLPAFLPPSLSLFLSVRFLFIRKQDKEGKKPSAPVRACVAFVDDKHYSCWPLSKVKASPDCNSQIARAPNISPSSFKGTKKVHPQIPPFMELRPLGDIHCWPVKLRCQN